MTVHPESPAGLTPPPQTNSFSCSLSPPLAKRGKKTPPLHFQAPPQHRATVLAADWAQFHKELHVVGGAEEVWGLNRLFAGIYSK